MKHFRPVLDGAARLSGMAWNWVRFSPYAGLWSTLLVMGVIVACMMGGYHESFMPQTPSPLEIPKSWQPPPDGAYIAIYLLAYLRLLVLVGGLVYHVYIIRAYPDVKKMILPTWIACGVVAFWAISSQIYGRWEAQLLNVTGEVFSTTAFFFQLLLLLGLLLTPPFVLSYYSKCRIMERYVMRSFLQPLFFCFIAFFTLWIVMDLLDNMQDFQQNNIGKWQIAMYYLKMMPSIYVTVAPITLLLATVYVLGRMSRTNEIISMLGAGRSMWQVLRPIYYAGCYAAFLGMAANYHWAPTAAGNKAKLLENMKERMNQNILVMGLMYRNQEAGRTWFLGNIPTDLVGGKIRRVEIRQEDEKGHLQKAWFAKSAYWWAPNDLNPNGVWSLYHGAEATYENGQLIAIKNFESDKQDRLDFVDWKETPWILMSASLTPDFLGVPDLISYIRANESYGSRKLAPFWTHLFYRFALPWQCIIVVMFAAPLAVVFSRRGLVGGIANAVIIFFVLMFLDNLFLNLGRSYRMPAIISVWMPHLFLGMLGLYLFNLRSQNRELPRIAWAGIRDYGVEKWENLRRRFLMQPRLDP
jgi:LPS export ABC transporter permease LptG